MNCMMSLKRRLTMNDIMITITLPNRDEDKDDIAYVVSRILDKSGIDNFIGDAETLDEGDIE